MATKHDKDVIGRFLQEYNAERQTSFKVVAWPDDIDRSGKAIDALASDGTAALGIEHTLLQPFTGERQDTAVFLKTVATLDKVPHLMLPNVSVTLSFEVAAVPKGVDWSSIAPAVEQWYLNIRQQFPEGRSHYVIASLPFTLEVIVDRTSLKHPRGFFFISRQMPTAHRNSRAGAENEGRQAHSGKRR